MVELIVVIVILAILAAILIPALLGYIDRAKQQQYVLEAKNCMTAAQTVFSKYYAKDQLIGTPNAGSGLSDVDMPKDIAQEILDTADSDPYLLMVGVGAYSKYYNTDIHKAYTVYFVIYWADKDSKPICFDGTNWTSSDPWSAYGLNDSRKEKNDFLINGSSTPVTVQFYLVSSKAGWTADSCWTKGLNAALQ